jgi:predicted  nucleic acid-binding Zn-ribbon protein
LALLPDFLVQLPLEIRESREAHIRVKSLGAAQQAINCRVTALEVLQRVALALHAASADELKTLRRQQSRLESSSSTTETALSAVQHDLLCLHSALESANRWECEVTESAAEVRSIRSVFENALQALSRRTDAAEERLSGQSDEIASVWVFAESVQKESALAHEPLSRDEADIARLAAEVAALRSHSDGAQKQLTTHVEKLGGLDRTEADIARVASEVATVAQLRADITALKGVIRQLCFGLLDSPFVSEFPPLFEEFRRKCFNLLWRGSRDGFTAKEFHRRCDSHANTLSLILDTDGNVFGGFTSVKWENNCGRKGDDSLRSFLFILKSPHGVPPRKFTLREERKECAIYCDSGYCAFGLNNCYSDILISDNCNASRNSWT